MKVRKLLSAIIAGAMVLCTMSFSVFADGEYTFDVDNASSLKTALNTANSANGQAVTINITANIDAADTEYAFNWNGATAESSQNLTINGNGYAISNMTTPLISSIWHGDILTINDLTINSANITISDPDDNGQSSSAAAFVAHIEASDYVTFNRCKLTNSTVSGGQWNGGFVGYAAGYSNINDGAVFTEITFNNCEVSGNTLSSKGSVGGLMGHAMGSTWTKVNIINTSIFSNSITCIGTSTQKAGAICGTIGCAGIEENGKTGGMIIDTTELANNTVKSNGVEISTFYGRQGNSTGVASIINKTLIVDSEVYTDDADFVQNLTYAAKIGNNYYATLADAVAAANTNDTIKLIADTTESSTITITDKTINIDFDGHKLNGSILINGNSVVTVEDGYIRQTELVSGIEVAGNANVTINNMDIESFRNAVRVDADDANCVATAVINGGKYVSTNNTTTCHGLNIGSPNGKSIVTVYDGKFYGPVNNEHGGNSLMVQNHNDDVKIYGGYFAKASGVEGCVCPADGLKIYGTNSPKFGTWGYERYIADDSVLVEGNGIYTVCATLADAVANAQNGDTIKLLNNASGNGVVVPSGSNITIDLGGFTYNVDGTTVGSSGTATQAFQLLKNSNITIKNGTITSDKAYMLIQNYSNLTLENVTLDGTNLDGAGTGRYVLSNNCGNTVFKGNTNIIAKEGDIAFDVCRYENYPSVTVTLDENMTGTITGNIELSDSAESSTVGAVDANSFNLIIKAGTVNGTIIDSRSNTQKEFADFGKISGGKFTTNVSAYLADGYKLTANDDGTFGVEVGEEETEPEILKKSLYVTYSQLGKFDFGDGEVNSIKLSLLGGIDSLNYSEVGFDVTVNGETQTFPVTVVYDSVKTLIDGKETIVKASEFGNGVNHVFGYTINFPATAEFENASAKWVPYAIRNNVKIPGNEFQLGDIFPGTLEVSK